jgi:CelD/BcsL family acetyltransferase involved in cellulose biosynthesis
MDLKLVLEREALRRLAHEVADAGLQPLQVEHTPAWLAETDHGVGSVAGVVRVDEGGRLVGYLPFRLRQTRFPVKLGEMVVARFPLAIVQIFGRGMVGEADGAIPGALSALLQLPRPFDAVALEETPTSSPLWRAAVEGRLPEFVVVERGRAAHRCIELPSTFDAYFSGLSTKARTNLRRSARRLDERFGGHALRVYAEPEQTQALVEAIEHVITKTFHYHLLGKDLTRGNAVFVRNLETCARHGLLRSYVLWAGATPVAYALGYRVGRRYQYEEIAYDPSPEVARAAPGNYLLSLIVGELIGSGVAHILDFGAGDAEYKRTFGNVEFEEGRMLLVRRALYARGVAAAERTFAGASRAAARVLDRAALRSRLKSLMRRSVRRSP